MWVYGNLLGIPVIFFFDARLREAVDVLRTGKPKKEILLYNPIAASMYTAISTLFLLQHHMVLWYALYVLFTIMGQLVSHFFFAFHLLDIVVRNEILQNVVRSVTYPRKQLVM